MRARASRDIVVAAFVYVPLSENTVQDHRVQSDVDVPEDPAPDNQGQTEKVVAGAIIVFEQVRRAPGHKGRAGMLEECQYYCRRKIRPGAAFVTLPSM